MATLTKAQSNRLNSRKSTGPRTPEGKAVVSQNATTHGLYSAAVVLPDEDIEEFNQLDSQVRSDFQPATRIESELVETVVSTIWRLRRARLIEAELMAMYRFYQGKEQGIGCAFAHDASQMGCFQRLSDIETALERRLFRVMKELRQIQLERKTKPPGTQIRSAASVPADPMVAEEKHDAKPVKSGFFLGFPNILNRISQGIRF